jgi:Ser/Thr protein kinase RdoA (MazF antagonist)
MPMSLINYSELNITTTQAEALALTHFGKKGSARPLTGEVDFNFKIKTETGESYILKVSRPKRYWRIWPLKILILYIQKRLKI